MRIPYPSCTLAVPPKEWTLLVSRQGKGILPDRGPTYCFYFSRDDAPFQLMFAKNDSM
jgi:hypothetical protein